MYKGVPQTDSFHNLYFCFLFNLVIFEYRQTGVWNVWKWDMGIGIWNTGYGKWVWKMGYDQSAADTIGIFNTGCEEQNTDTENLIAGSDELWRGKHCERCSWKTFLRLVMSLKVKEGGMTVYPSFHRQNAGYACYCFTQMETIPTWTTK